MGFLRGGPAGHIEFLRAAVLATAGLDQASRSPSREFLPMIDILLLALGLGFFGLMAAYAAACEKV